MSISDHGFRGRPGHPKAEVERLRRERDLLRRELRETRGRFRRFARSSGEFASSMRSRIGEQRRLDLQYAVLHALQTAASADEGIGKVLETLGERLGRRMGIFWTLDGDALRRAGLWKSPVHSGGALEQACRDSSFRRGSGLPGRVWEENRPLWIEDLGKFSEDPRSKAAARDGLRGVLAFPVGNGDGLLGVVELCGPEPEVLDEALLRTVAVLGYQVGQFIERRRAETALRKSEEHTRLALEVARLGSWSWDPFEERVFADARCREVCGLDPAADLAFSDFVSLVHPGDRPRVEAALAAALQPEGEGHFAEEFRLVRADGSTRWVISHGKATVEGKDRRTARVLGTVLDVTEHRRAQEALRESEERFRFATESAEMCAWEVDVTTRRIEYSENAAGMLGFDSLPDTLDEAISMIPPEDREHTSRELARAVEKAGALSLEHRAVNAANEVLWLEEHGRVIRGGDGRPARVIGIAQNVTRRKQAQEERERLRARERVARAAAAERERISRELHDRVAHEMGVVHQSLQLYEALASRDPERAMDRLRVAKEMATVAMESTRNLSAELRRSEAEDGLEDALRDFAGAAVSGETKLGFSFDGDEAPVPGHTRGQLYLILCEAVRNAVRHSRCRSMDVGVAVLPDGISSFVEDDGHGFDANGKGYEGVGLRSMRERAELLGGSLRLTSSPESGARVEIHVPLGEGGDERER